MPWPVADAWNQHLDEMNRQPQSQPAAVALVRLEGPFDQGWAHTEHVHPYWQLEAVRSAGFTVRCGRREFAPGAGEILLLPPQTWHHFRFPTGKDAWTVKFAAPELTAVYPPGVLPQNEATALVFDALWRVCRPEPQLTPELRLLLERLIAAALELYCRRFDGPGKENELLRAVREQIEAAVATGRGLTVGELAQARRCSAAYLNRVFRQRLGLPVKGLIDQHRFEAARRLVEDSALPLTDIAAELGFDDVFRFSRFFKRLSGESPRAWRQRAAAQGRR